MYPHRTADPYRDLAVIDTYATRFNQAFVGFVAATAVASELWQLVALVALQLTLGLLLGRRWCLPCVFYFEVLQPRFGEGPLEDARPPRFANIVGATFLWASTLAYLGGLPRLGAAIALLVTMLALLACVTGLCAGCAAYRLWAHVRGVRRRPTERIDLAELGAAPADGLIVHFTHPLCTDCQDLAHRLHRLGRRVVAVDVSKHPELARKYGVSVVPLAYEVRADGSIASTLEV